MKMRFFLSDALFVPYVQSRNPKSTASLCRSDAFRFGAGSLDAVFDNKRSFVARRRRRDGLLLGVGRPELARETGDGDDAVDVARDQQRAREP